MYSIPVAFIYVMLVPQCYPAISKRGPVPTQNPPSYRENQAHHKNIPSTSQVNSPQYSQPGEAESDPGKTHQLPQTSVTVPSDYPEKVNEALDQKIEARKQKIHARQNTLARLRQNKLLASQKLPPLFRHFDDARTEQQTMQNLLDNKIKEAEDKQREARNYETKINERKERFNNALQNRQRQLLVNSRIHSEPSLPSYNHPSRTERIQATLQRRKFQRKRFPRLRRQIEREAAHAAQDKIQAEQQERMYQEIAQQTKAQDELEYTTKQNLVTGEHEATEAEVRSIEVERQALENEHRTKGKEEELKQKQAIRQINKLTREVKEIQDNIQRVGENRESNEGDRLRMKIRQAEGMESIASLRRRILEAERRYLEAGFQKEIHETELKLNELYSQNQKAVIKKRRDMSDIELKTFRAKARESQVGGSIDLLQAKWQKVKAELTIKDIKARKKLLNAELRKSKFEGMKQRYQTAVRNGESAHNTERLQTALRKEELLAKKQMADALSERKIIKAKRRQLKALFLRKTLKARGEHLNAITARRNLRGEKYRDKALAEVFDRQSDVERFETIHRLLYLRGIVQRIKTSFRWKESKAKRMQTNAAINKRKMIKVYQNYMANHNKRDTLVRN